MQRHDPLANAAEVHRVYGIERSDVETLSDSEAVVLAEHTMLDLSDSIAYMSL